MKEFLPSTRSTGEAFQVLNRDLKASRARVIRFSSGTGLQAILVPYSSLESKSQQFVAQLQAAGGFPADDSILFVSSPDAAAELKNLLVTAGRVPDWVAIPGASAGSIEIQGRVEHATGSVQSRDEIQRHLSFTLYPFEPPAMKPVALEPVKAKIPEPAQNLQQRAQWFRNRRKTR